MPIVEQGVQTGAVLTCQDPVSIQRVDRNLRARLQPRAAAARYALADLVGTSAALERAKALAASCARSHATVLVIGESGTGKELLAQGIHGASPRHRQPFVAINCAAFPEALLESELFGHEEGAFTGSRRGGKAGLFEAAHTGTIFLDEVGEMPVSLQTRLLRVLQEREIVRIGSTEPTPIDVRVIAATHRNLDTRLASGEFRADLYFRLNILRVDLPPLRERRDDVPVLAAHLLRKIVAQRAGMAPPPATLTGPLVAALVEQAADYAWRGNVRELENFIERLVVYCDQLDRLAPVADPADALRGIAPELYAGAAAAAAAAPDLAGTGRGAERQRLIDVLQACGGDRARACARLGISRTTLWRKLKDPGRIAP